MSTCGIEPPDELKNIGRESKVIINISNLKVTFHTNDGPVRAIDSVSIKMHEGEKLGLIGESGCGKTVLGHAIMRILDDDAEVHGNIIFRGEELYSLDMESMRKIRGEDISIILQNPGASLNPSLNIGTQISEVFIFHKHINKKAAWDKAVSLLERVEINNASRRVYEYPHQYSGGMKERVAIAIGIASEPALIIADEPTRGLDVSVKRNIVKLLSEVTGKKAMLVITHDLDVADKICDTIAVMYAGELVEIAPMRLMFDIQMHPYARGFFASAPSRGLVPIRGISPSLIHLPEGCRFHPRCDHVMERCKKEHPELIELDKGRYVRCFLYA